MKNRLNLLMPNYGACTANTEKLNNIVDSLFVRLAGSRC